MSKNRVYFKCLYEDVCDNSKMDKELGLVICSSEDLLCEYCELCSTKIFRGK